MKLLRLIFLSLCIGNMSLAQDIPEPAPAGTQLQKVWHLGRVTGDLERIVAFYHNLLGLGFRGDRAAPVPFYSVPTINEFVGAPAHAEFRAAFMPIPGASDVSDPAQQIYLEAFEFRNIERHQGMPQLADPGVSNLTFLVRDLDVLVATMKAAGTAFITANATPIAVATPQGFYGDARAVMLRDPDGYPVQLLELNPAPAALTTNQSVIRGAHLTLIVADLDAALAFYRSFIGIEADVQPGPWHIDASFNELRALPPAEFRSAALQLPASALVFELVEFRGIAQKPYRPQFQDIGFGHIAFNTNDIEQVVTNMQQLGITSLSRSGTWTQINPGLRAVYTRDHDGFFLEIIHNGQE